jgi:hypothetical protein
MSSTESAPKPPAKRTRSQSPAAAAGRKAVAERRAAQAAAKTEKLTRAQVAQAGKAGTDPLPGKQEPAGPSQDDVDDAVTQLADELGGTTDDATRERVAARAAEVKAEQDAAPAKPKRGRSADAIAATEAKRKAQDERVAKVIEMRKAGKKLSEIAAELGYSSQQVVSSTLRRHAPDLQVAREHTGGLTLTAAQAKQLNDLESKFGARLNTLARALDRYNAANPA